MSVYVGKKQLNARKASCLTQKWLSWISKSINISPNQILKLPLTHLFVWPIVTVHLAVTSPSGYDAPRGVLALKLEREASVRRTITLIAHVPAVVVLVADPRLWNASERCMRDLVISSLSFSPYICSREPRLLRSSVDYHVAPFRQMTEKMHK